MDILEFSKDFGFPALIAGVALTILYRGGMLLVSRHIQVLDTVEKTQAAMLETQMRMLGILEHLMSRLEDDERAAKKRTD